MRRKKSVNVNPEMLGKQDFIAYIEKIGIKNGLVDRVESLPDIIHVNDYDYKLNICTSWHREGVTYHEFEMNYYSEENMEFLLTYKIFKDIEISLTYLECELVRRGFLDADTECHL